jgi:hypothetical protein
MKLKFTRQSLKAILALGVCSCLLAQPSFASGKPFRNLSSLKADPGEEEPAKKNKVKAAKTKTFSSRNNNSVKIYPDILKRDMHVVAKYNEGKEIDFFVFDLQGTLKQNYKMKAKDQYRITGLEKGTYIYRVFCGDEETAAGKFEIR